MMYPNVRFKHLPHKKHWAVLVNHEHVGYIKSESPRMEWIKNILENWVERDQSLIVQAVMNKITALNVARRLKQ